MAHVGGPAGLGGGGGSTPLSALLSEPLVWPALKAALGAADTYDPCTGGDGGCACVRA
jgi:hypothetical protein